MSPEFRSLLSKEWSERRRLFFLGVGLLVLFLGYGCAYEIEYRTRAFVASYYANCMVFGWLAAILLAMTTATGEYTRRTLRYSASLPISLSSVAWARLLGAWGCIGVPIILGALLATPLLASGFFEQAELRPADYAINTVRLPDRGSLSPLGAVGFLWTATAIAVVGGIQLVTLVSLVGTWCRREGTVGLLGAIVALAMASLVSIRSTLDSSGLYIISDWIGGLLPGTLAISWGYGEIDGSSYTDLELARSVFAPLVINGVLSVALGWWFARRYGRLATAESRDVSVKRWRILPVGPRLVSRLGVRWRSPLWALAWLNARQAVPLCLAGLALSVVITLVSLTEGHSPNGFAARLAGELPSSTWFVGCLFGAIVAVGIFASELAPDREQFWRSRPISPHTWFWMKFAVGLAALLLTLDVFPSLVSLLSPHRPDTGRVGLAYAACIPLLHTLTYAVAVAAVCHMRQAIPAAIVALVLFFAMDQVLESIPVHPKLSTMNVYNKLQSREFNRSGPPGSPVRRIDLRADGYPLVYGIVAQIIVAASLLAWRNVLPPVARNRALVLVALIGLSGLSAAQGAEPVDVAGILAKIQQRESAIHSLHLRWTSRLVRTEEFYTITAAEAARPGQARLPIATKPLPRLETQRYEYFDHPPRRAWTEFGPDGSVKSTTAFDGTYQRAYTGHGSSLSQGWVRRSDHVAPPLHFGPEAMLNSFAGNQLPTLLTQLKLDPVVLRDVEGEQFADITGTQVISVNENGAPLTYEQRYHITVNLARSVWPARLELEVRQQPAGRLISRIVTTVENWAGTKPIDFPKRVVQKSYFALPSRPATSSDLVLSTTNECDVDLVEINSGIPDSAFKNPFPPGAVFYDFDNLDWYQAGPAGEQLAYIPVPKGQRGAVLTYHLIWITAACLYLVRRLGLFKWRTIPPAAA